MAAKKTTKKAKATKKKAGGAAVLAPSPCRQRGRETPSYVYASPGQRIDAFLQVCGAAAQVIVSLHSPGPTSVGGTPLFSGRMPPAPNPLVITIPPLPTGVHVIMWTYAVAGIWDVVAELHVEAVARFRKLNSHGDDIPVNAIWTYLEIV